jgi:protocatechuate 3,4-dioxygenase beta subunit/protocatechuate 3,4-dioxygenase alpha subunit
MSLPLPAPLSAEDTIGPYYPIGFVDDFSSDLTVPKKGIVCKPRGQAIVLTARLLDKHGESIPAALVEFWQANAEGRYRTGDNAADPELDPNLHGFGRLRTSGERFEYRTVKPGKSGDRAPHISIMIFCDGISRVTTQIFFDDEAEDNARDPLLVSLPEGERKLLVARRVSGASDAIHYALDIVLSGEGETPFFDDVALPGDTTSRTLRAGETDMAADARVPVEALRAIPEGLVDSFTPCYPDPPGLRRGEDDLTRIGPGRPQAEGETAVVRGKVTDQHGNPLPDVLMEIWNANPHGRYTHVDDPAEQPLDPFFYGFGRVLTDEDGNYEFSTIRPGAYLARADIGRYRPAHVHFSLIGGRSRLITQMYFEGDPHLERDPAYSVLGDRASQKRQVARQGTDGVYRFDIVMRSVEPPKS